MLKDERDAFCGFKSHFIAISEKLIHHIRAARGHADLSDFASVWGLFVIYNLMVGAFLLNMGFFHGSVY